MSRLAVTKTYKLYIGGKFPRSESGRSIAIEDDGDVIAHICRASRKDLRDAVDAARAAQQKWATATAYNRGQVLYRIAEMLEGRREDFVDAICATCPGGRRSAEKEVDAAIDRLVAFAGWTDKFSQVLGGHNPIAGPYYNFTIPEPTGVVGVVCPDTPALLGMVTLLAPAVCAGNAVVVLASQAHPLAAVLLAEACATSDVPGGVVNILTGDRDELIEHFAEHREINAISAANLRKPEVRTLEGGTAGNMKRVFVTKHDDTQWHDPERCESPWTIEPFVEMKTIWHPSAM